MQINVVVNDLHGRVHITEAADNVEEVGTCNKNRYTCNYINMGAQIETYIFIKSDSGLCVSSPLSEV